MISAFISFEILQLTYNYHTIQLKKFKINCFILHSELIFNSECTFRFQYMLLNFVQKGQIGVVNPWQCVKSVAFTLPSQKFSIMAKFLQG